MALPPTIPTSFVPHPGSVAARRRTDLAGAFVFFAYGVLGLSVLMAIGVFIYDSILISRQSNEDAALASAIAGIDPSTVAGFVHLRDRLSSGGMLLDKHPSFTAFFGVLSSILPASVRLSDLHLSLDDSGIVMVAGDGSAKSFNALAAASDAFANDGRIKDAIFSGIKVNNGFVSFTFSATLDPALVAFSPPAPAPALAPSVSTSTATTSP